MCPLSTSRSMRDSGSEGCSWTTFWRSSSPRSELGDLTWSDSGLALDLLEYHISLSGYGRARTDLNDSPRYPHRSEVLESLVDQCKSLYLLIRSQAGTEPANRLADDAGPSGSGSVQGVSRSWAESAASA